MANFRYLPNTDQDRQAMLDKIGVKDIMDIFSDIPKNVLREGKMNLPEPLSEMEIVKELGKMAAKNTTASQVPYFLGCLLYTSDAADDCCRV